MISSVRTDRTKKSLSIVGRRKFVAAGAAVGLAACGSSTESEGEPIVTLAELESQTMVTFDVNEHPCVIVALSDAVEHGVGPDSNIVAYSTVCPHMGCPLSVEAVDPEKGTFGPCGCHQSVFDLRHDGRLVYGRAATNLPRVALAVRGSTIYALGATRPAFGTLLSTNSTDLEVSE